jgi:hypothetical protein
MSEPPPNRNPAFQAVIRRLLARRPPQPRSAPGKSQARSSSKKKPRAA